MAAARLTGVVAVVAADIDARAAEALIAGLVEYGVDADAGDECGAVGPGRAVVLLSAAGVRDVRWAARVDRLNGARVVPVRLGQMNAEDVPHDLRELNWIAWPEPNRHRPPTAEVFTALHTDLSRYRVHRSLASEAQIWDVAGRPDFLLIGSGVKVRLAAAHLRDAEREGLSAPTPLINAFVAASIKLARRERRRRTRRWAFRATIAAMVTVLAAFAVTSLRVAGKSSDLLAMGSASQWMIDERPDRIAMLSAGVLLQTGYVNRSLARRTLVDVLGRQWSYGVLGSAHTSRLLDAVITSDGNRTITFDGEGSLTAWDNRSASVMWRRGLAGAGPAGVIDADPGLDLVVVASNDVLHAVRVDPWQDSTTKLPAEGVAIALAPSGEFAVVRIASGSMLIVPFDGGPVMTSPLPGSVVDVTRTEAGDMLALVRDGPDLVLGDPRSGTVVARQQMPKHRFEGGAVGTDGSVAWAGPDRQIYYAPDHLRFHPTGEAVPDQLEVLKVLSRGRIVYGGSQFGIKVYDARAEATVGRICRTLVGVGKVVMSSNGDMVACLDYYMVDLWQTAILSPLAAPPELTSGLGIGQTGGNSQVQIVGSDTGRVEFTFAPANVGGLPRLASVELHSKVTAVAASSDGNWTAIGTANGDVVQYEPGKDGLIEVGRWVAPDYAPITMLGLNPHDEERMLVQTGGHRWWSPRACTGCATERSLVQRVQDRLWGCYTINQIERLTDDSREVLRIKLCADSPRIGN